MFEYIFICILKPSRIYTIRDCSTAQTKIEGSENLQQFDHSLKTAFKFLFLHA